MLLLRISWFISLCLIDNWYYLKLFMVKIVHYNLNNYNNNKNMTDMSSTRHKTSLHKMIQDFNLTLNKDDNLSGRTGNNKDLDGWRKCSSQQLHPCVVSLTLLRCKPFKCHWICHSVMILSVHLAHLMMYNYFEGTVSTQVIICWLHSDVTLINCWC